MSEKMTPKHVFHTHRHTEEYDVHYSCYLMPETSYQMTQNETAIPVIAV